MTVQRPPAEDFAALIDGVAAGVVTIDRQWRFTYVNRAMLAGVARSAPEMVGRGVWEVFPELESSRYRQACERAWELRELVRVEDWVPSFGSWFEAIVHPSGDQLTVFLRDTTHHRRRDRAGEIRAALATALDPDAGPVDTLLRLTRRLRRLVGAELAELWVCDHPGAPLRLAGADHPEDATLAAVVAAAQARDLPATSVVRRALAGREPVEVDRLADPDAFHRSVAAERAGLRTSLHLPVVVDGAPSAVVGLLSRRASGASDWFTCLAECHADLVDLVSRQRELHDLTRVFELSSSMLVVAGLDGYFKRLNPRWSEVLGYTERELLARPFAAFVHPDDRDATAAVLKSLAGGQPLLEFRNRYLTADGDERTLAWTSRPMPEEGLIFGVARDVTIEVRERALEDAERDLLGRILLGSPLVRTLRDLARTVEARFPDALCAIHHYDLESDTLRVVTGPSLPDAFLAAIDRQPVGPSAGACGTAAHRRRTVVIEDLLTDPLSGGYRELASLHGLRSSWSEPILGADGELLGTIVVYRRVPARPDERERRVLTDLARFAGVAFVHDVARSQLVDSEHRLRRLAQATSDAIWDWDLATGAVRWSPGFEALFGDDRAAGESEPGAWTDRIHAGDRPAVVASLEAALEDGSVTWSREFRILRSDGTPAHVVARGSIVRDHRGRAVRLIGGLVDDSERHELEQQYLRAQRLESIGTLAGGIAHDLNNVLAPIVMAADLLSFGELSDQQADMVSTIATSARRGASMVRQVLSFARGAAPETSSVDPGQLLTEVQRMVRDTFPKNIEVVVSPDEGVSPVVGDLGQLQQILLNLAVNARDAMPNGGRVTFTAANRQHDDAHEAPEHRPGPYVAISVIDTGVGIPPQIRERLFEPFFTTKEPGKGTGLGLSTSHALAAAHQGFLTVSSEPGRGATFTVHLPVASAPAIATDPGVPAGLPRGNGELVLVVDDEASVRTITKQTLEAFGYRVVTADDGAQAVATFAAHRDEVAVVVTDVMMPVMDGTAAITALRRLDPGVPIIAASGLGQPVRRRAQAPEVTAFLLKPFTSEALLRTLADALQGGPGGSS